MIFRMKSSIVEKIFVNVRELACLFWSVFCRFRLKQDTVPLITPQIFSMTSVFNLPLA